MNKVTIEDIGMMVCGIILAGFPYIMFLIRGF